MFESPDAVVAAARRAAADRDWVGLYRCFEPAVIRTIAGNTWSGLAGHLGYDDAVLRSLCDAHGVPAAVVDAEREAVERITTSAAKLDAADPADPYDSAVHHRLVKEMTAARNAVIDAAPDPPAFAGALEHLLRDRIGGGSVSSSLFAGDELTDVTIDGTSARGVLRRGSTERPLRFKRRRDGWRISSLTAR